MRKFYKGLFLFLATAFVLGCFALMVQDANADEAASRVGKTKEIHVLNLQDQDTWITVHDGEVAVNTDTTATAIDISEGMGSPQFFAYTCCVNALGATAPGIWIDYKIKVDPDDTTSYDTKFNEYYIVHEDSVIAADSCFSGGLTVYGSNRLIFTFHNAEAGAADSADVLFKLWMKH